LLASCEGNFETHFRLFRLFGPFKHVVEPYARYTYATTPTSLIPNHYVFSSEDAYTHLSYLRFGMRNFLHTKGACNNRPFACDLFAYAFFSTPTIVGSVPRLYTDLSWHVRPDVTTQVRLSWNLSHNQVDHFRSRLAMTVSEDFAFSLEFRYRSAFEYLKADPFNWVLDSFKQESDLLKSRLSDRRCTVLTDCFLRITPTIAIQLETHHGFKRRHAAPYNEAKITFYKIFRCRWHFSIFFEHLEIDNRCGVHLKLGPGKCPKPLGHTPTVW
ncbi:MAG: hypothetical protein JSR80_04375, partial [Verrucomicrobia bacterium]|nr:hypothetical protein [Verrucomicrobiota bacterium]